MRKDFLVFLVCLMAVCLSAGQAMAVKVYAEGAYDSTTLDVYIYADIDADAVLSYGVKLTYNDSALAVLSAEKDVTPIPYTTNGTKWYLGDATASYRNNPLPDTSTAGEVMFIGGKLDPGDPTAGVGVGSRVFLGKVTFGPVAPASELPADPASHITGLSYARGSGSDNYKNFVRYDDTVPAPDPPAEVLDGAISFEHPDASFGGASVVIRPRGDVNASGQVTGADRSALRYFLTHTGEIPYPWKDCNASGQITGADRSCIRYILTH